jgi:hypothetical protein
MYRSWKSSQRFSTFVSLAAAAVALFAALVALVAAFVAFVKDDSQLASAQAAASRALLTIMIDSFLDI